MATLSKKWGTVIGCWCVALVMIITGVCLGLVIPSSAAEEYKFMITCGDKVAYGRDFNDLSIDNLMESGQTNVLEMKLLDDIHYDNGEATMGLWSIINADGTGMNWILDLNGHVFSTSYGFYLNAEEGSSITIKDSNPSATRYIRQIETENSVSYKFYDTLPDGVYGTEIKGGVIAAGSRSNGGEFVARPSGIITIDGGNFYGIGGVGNDLDFGENGKFTLNNGNWQVYATAEKSGMDEYGVTGFVSFALDGYTLEINGGSIYGQIIEAAADGAVRVVELDKTLPTDSKVVLGDNIEMKADETESGVKVYTAVDATTGKPVVPEQPDVPAVTEQPANNNNNLFGLIILGAAAAVMVVGVTVIIIVNTKRRKKVA